MELTTLRLEVRERLGELTADFFTDDEVDRAINEAVKRFCAEEKWPFLITEWTSSITSASDELPLPSNVSLTRLFNLAIDSSSLAHPRMLERVDPQEGFALRHQYDTTTGSPRWYYIASTNLSVDEAPPIVYTARLIPAPDGDYDVEAQYMAVPVELSGASDEPMVPEEYQDAIPAWAAGKLFLKELSISQKANEQFAIYQKVLSQARADLKSFDLDEVVAWGRRHPLRGPWASTSDVYGRIPPTLGT